MSKEPELLGFEISKKKREKKEKGVGWEGMEWNQPTHIVTQ